MKYLKQIDDGAWAVGHLRPDKDCDDGELVFFAEQCFDTREEAEDYVAGKNDKYRAFANAYVVPRSFGEDLCRKADAVRKLRDELGREAGISISYHSYYQNSDYLQTYGKCDISGNEDSRSIEARQFWAHKTYLDGLADAAYELGFTLCWDCKEQRHVTRGCALEPIIREA